MESYKQSYWLPCGGKALWDHTSDCGHRCSNCFTVVGSVGMPRECFELLKKENPLGPSRQSGDVNGLLNRQK